MAFVYLSFLSPVFLNDPVQLNWTTFLPGVTAAAGWQSALKGRTTINIAIDVPTTPLLQRRTESSRKDLNQNVFLNFHVATQRKK
jgi:hypothetical protein